MFNKIKFYLSKITVERKSYLFLLSLFIFFSLFLVAKPANADFLGIGDAFWGMLESQLDALDFVDSVVLELLFYLILGLAMSQAYLYSSAKLFQWAIDFPINLGITTENPLVTSGWQFTSGLVNTFFILIFIIIALAYILRIETFGAKKALPRLIIVAVLLNFSLVFIGIGVDISQLTLKAITGALGSDLPLLAMTPITNSIQNLISGYLGIMGAYTVGALIPYVNVAGAFAIIATIVNPAFLGTFSMTILLIILSFALGSIFLLYATLFIIRVGMIWMLAILSPLAFASWILPGTRKHWEEWWKLLINWLFFGIIVVLLGGLGLKLFAESTVVPEYGPLPIGPQGLFPAFTYNYLFLLIYMGLMLFYSTTKFAPELAGVLISQGKSLMKRGAPMAGTAGRSLKEWVRRRKGVQEWADKQAEAATPELKGLRKAATIPVRAVWALRRGIGRTLGPRLREEEKRTISEAESETEKTKEPLLVVSKTLDNIAAGKLTEAIGRLSKAIEKGGPFKKSIVEKVTPEQAVTLVKRAHDMGAVPQAERIGRAFIDEAHQMSFPPLEPSDRAKGYGTIQDKLIGDARKDEIKDFTKGFWGEPEAMEAIQNFLGGPQLRRLADEFGRDFVDAYMQPIRQYLDPINTLAATDPDEAERKFKEFVHVNPRRALYLASSGAQELGFESLYAAAPEHVRDKYKNIKEIVAEKP